ncbi:alanine/glycine:cation symporter family protein [Algimonas porphyrae]|uniref:Sodium:alanine symporter n=1 Tax=Algimonas porphyrae TaxID=1128113 RepID=A0ABQ5V0Z8_9PROT|nr:sodium:alanine symporter family protein [Algimonas porphyrae]GLQ20695.1 sodium:alanine symporter [Algimonas porphyrae]
MESLIQWVNNQVWGWPMLGLLLLTGAFLTVGLRFISIYKIPYAFKQLFRKRGANTDDGDVSPFAALMTALSSTIGTGNIAGVAAAIAIGGPGAVFWMWVTAVLGTATKFSEGVLAVRYREIDSNGNRVGGPMYYIKNGLGSKWMPLALLFSFFGMFASWGTGNSIQANSVADVLNAEYNLSPWITAVFLAGGAAAVILGGIKRIGSVASKVVPFMAGAYILLGLLVVIMNISAVPGAFSTIFKGAFGLQEAGTGISIGLMVLAMQKGVARGIFSNEAGQGSAPIAHAAAQNNDPVNQGTIAMLGTVIDTLFVCTITALVILTSGVVSPECLAGPENYQQLMTGMQPAGCDTGAPLTSSAFAAQYGEMGRHLIPIALTIFAFTTILGWSYYGERCAAFMFSEKAILPYRIIYIAVVFFSAAAIALEDQIGNIVNLFWLMADTLTGLMAAPNLIALIFLSPVVFKLTRDYFDRDKEATDGLIDQDDLPRGS